MSWALFAARSDERVVVVVVMFVVTGKLGVRFIDSRKPARTLKFAKES